MANPIVSQSGAVVPGHFVSWLTDGLIQDGGSNPAGTIIQIGNVTAGHLAVWTANGQLQDGGPNTLPLVASTAQYLNNTPSLLLSTDQTWAAAAPVVLTDGATVTPDFSLGINFSWTLGAVGRSFASPINAKVGQSGVIYLIQGGPGSCTITTWGAAYKFSLGVKPVLSTSLGLVDILSYTVQQITPSLLVNCFFTQGMG